VRAAKNRSFSVRREAVGAFAIPRCLPSVSDPRLCMPITGTDREPTPAPRFCTSRHRPSASFAHGLPRIARSAARLPRRAGTRVACALARIVIHGLSPRSRASPSTSGTALLWAVAAYRLLQTRFNLRARPRAPSSSPAAESDEPLAGLRFSCVCAMSASKEASHPQRAEEVL